jgi:hypothetical protein
VVVAAIGAALGGFVALWSMIMFWTSPSKCQGGRSLVSCYFGPAAAVTVGCGLASAAIAAGIVAFRRRQP